MLGFTHKIRRSARQYAEYRRIVSEIQALSPREAADVGIFQSDAHLIARKAVYGA